MRNTVDFNPVLPGEERRNDNQISQTVAASSAVERQPRDTQATGKAPTDMPGMADNTQGQPGTATSVAKQGLPDTVGNVNHDVPNVETAMTIDEIRYSGAGGGIF